MPIYPVSLRQVLQLAQVARTAAYRTCEVYVQASSWLLGFNEKAGEEI